MTQLRTDKMPQLAIQGIRDLNVFDFDDSGIRCWKASRFGVGYLVKPPKIDLPKVGIFTFHFLPIYTYSVSYLVLSLQLLDK